MIGELEALVGNLFVVGGRAISAPPPGALVAPPPKKAARGREQDTFFALLTPTGIEQAQAAFYEQLARLAADLYFASSGSVTSGLREAITGVNSHLMTSPTPRYQANVITMVLRGHEVYIARVGASLLLLRQGDTLISAPDDPRDEYALNGLPLGYSPSLDVKLAHYEIALGQVLALADAGLAAANRDQLKAALGAADLAATLDALKPLAAPRTQAMIVRFAIGTPQPISAVPSVIVPTANPVPALSAPLAPAPPTAVPVAKPIAKPLKPSSHAVDPGKPRGLQVITRPILGTVVFILRGIARILNGILDRLLPEPVDGSPHIPAAVAVGAAILIPAVIVAIMVGLRLTQVDETNFEKLVTQVQAQAVQAAAIPTSSRDQARALWQAVLQRVDEAEQVHSGDPSLAKIRLQAQTVLDSFAGVTRRPTTPLRSYDATAALGAVLVQGGTDIYTLDLANSAVYRDVLRQPDLIGTRGGQPIVQKGTAVGSYSVKNIVGMIWLDEGGIRTSHALVGLDTQGVLITYSPTFAPALSEPLQGVDRWIKPIKVRSWQDKLYILDPAANQIWRYLPDSTTYPKPPEEYFTDAYQRQLANATDFAIDEKGNVYVLFADGSLKEYTSGAEQPFALNGLPDGKLKSASTMYLDSTSALPALFVIDSRDQSIYEFTLSGAFQARFRSTDVNAFAHLSSVFADGNTLYVTSGQMLYYLNIANPAPKPQ